MNFYFKIKNGGNDEKSYLLHEAMTKITELHFQNVDFVMSTAPVTHETERIAHIRNTLKARKIKVKDFAKNLGYNDKHISKIFGGHTPMTEEIYLKMCELLEIEPLK
jgi:DNA-binding Xre family transcriptional regulator